MAIHETAPREGNIGRNVETRRFQTGNIYLVALRWAGKTTLGEPLAQKLGKNFVDLDRVAEERLGMSISDFVSLNDGDWAPFREIESQILKEMSLTRRDTVFATGGGVGDRPVNRRTMRRNGLVVYLEASAEVLMQRARLEIATRGRRKPPLLTGSDSEIDEIPTLLAQRGPIYAKIADIKQSAELNNIETEVEAITNKLAAFKPASPRVDRKGK